MKFDEYLRKLPENAEPNERRQIVYVLSQLDNDNTEPCVSDEEESAEESEDDISYYAEETDNAPYGEKSVLIAGEELLSEFMIYRDNAFQQSKVSSRKPSEVNYDIQEENKDRPITPVYGFTKTPIDPRVPSAMRAKPKIPRTPIPQEKLEEIKKADEEFFKQAIYIPRNANEQKPKKGGKVTHEEQPISEVKQELHHAIPETVRKKDEVKTRMPEEKKFPKDIKKESQYASVKRDQLASVTFCSKR
jgi:hypothetical protein